MRQYGVILIAVVVLIAGYVARRQLAVPTATTEAVAAAEAAVLAAAEGLQATLAAGEREPGALAPKIAELRRACQSLEPMRSTTACPALRQQAEALERAARNASIGDATVQDIAASVAGLRAEMQPR
ncbi:MAG: hypothetical protein IPO88_17780 [Nannocystis sp.]|uniref:hypothetical protein n=1 Tax=Nannocystis sp. TaxID=1962667 RepID=UPI002424484D|nr:hypothetical protein [Nannocystis sp.]MBK9755317.1 hypothetical protein [Nannocystis sp.]